MLYISNEPGLRDAALLGDSALVRRLLEAGHSVDAVDGNGRSALWYAAYQSPKVDVIRELLDAGASPLLADPDGTLPIHAAAALGRKEAVALLLLAAPQTAAAKANDGSTALLAFCRASADPDTLPQMIEAAPQAASMPDDAGPLPIHAAATAGYSGAAVPILLQAAPQTAAARDAHGRTPLHYAARAGSLAAVRALPEAAPSAAVDRENAPCLPLEMAVSALADATRYAGAGNASISFDVARRRDVALCLVEATPPANCLATAAWPAYHFVCLPLYPRIVSCHALNASQWQIVPTPCPGLAAALPSVLDRSDLEAALLVAHLRPADQLRLRTFALCLARTQCQLHLHLPGPLVSRILSLFDAA